MDIVIADKSKNAMVIHPITLSDVPNEKNKYLTMPTGPTNNMNEQSFFTSVKQPINNNHMDLFLSNEYFFKAMFNAEDFDSCIEVLNTIMDSDCHPETAAFLVKRFTGIFMTSNDSKKQEFINIHIKYYSKFENKDYTYAEIYEKIENKKRTIKNN